MKESKVYESTAVAGSNSDKKFAIQYVCIVSAHKRIDLSRWMLIYVQ